MGIPLVRAQHLIHYIEILRDVGVGVERELERSGLPVWIEEMPNEYVHLPRSLDWVGRCSSDAQIMELGFIAARGASVDKLNPEVQRALIAAPTAFARIAALSRVVHLEDSAVTIDVRRERNKVRVVCETNGFRNHAFLGFAEWINLEAITAILRSAAGPDWSPEEMTFVSKGRPSQASLAAYGNTRIRVGQSCASILVDPNALARTCFDRKVSRHKTMDVVIPRDPPSSVTEEWDFIATLRAAVRPYLSQGHPDLSLASEIAGLSRRTLQRRLEQCGQTYSQIVQEARFEVASRQLADPSRKIVDIAFAAGYENAQHFSRAFKRYTGMTPGDYRRAAVD